MRPPPAVPVLVPCWPQARSTSCRRAKNSNGEVFGGGDGAVEVEGDVGGSPQPRCHLPTPGITNPKLPKDATKHFTFDYSYWSHTSVSARRARGDLRGLRGSLTHCPAGGGPQLRLAAPGVPGHRGGDAGARLRGLQRLHPGLRPDWRRQVLHHDGAAGAGAARDHPAGSGPGGAPRRLGKGWRPPSPQLNAAHPQLCEDLFARIAREGSPELSFSVEVRGV